MKKPGSFINRVKSVRIHRIISADVYPNNRMDRIHLYILYRVSMAKVAKTNAERSFCSTMIVMYKRRYEWYLNKYLIEKK